MNKGPEDIYTFLRFAGATEMGPYAFAQYYFEQPRDVQLDRARELRELIQSVSLRRTYKSVGAQIPGHILHAVSDRRRYVKGGSIFRRPPRTRQAHS